MYFKVGTTDYSNNIEPDKYSVNSTKEYKSWQDGNYREHRVYLRDRIKGTMALWFVSNGGADYDSFLRVLEDNTDASGVLTATVKVNNTNQESEIGAFYSIKSETNRVLDHGETLVKIELEIMEA
ncbi:MAG: hypothetical protein MJZ26_12265 [Fibrobacter sp.]|nr:hypothetical protein [Fibrobacter sp.]